MVLNTLNNILIIIKSSSILTMVGNRIIDIGSWNMNISDALTLQIIFFVLFGLSAVLIALAFFLFISDFLVALSIWQCQKPVIRRFLKFSWCILRGLVNSSTGVPLKKGGQSRNYFAEFKYAPIFTLPLSY